MRQAKFVIDVLVYEDDPCVKKAMQYVTNNVLLGETPLDARDLAYNLKADERFDAISLDGTQFKKNGSISSGSW
jgi:structural maintenance of chromosome 1